MTTPRLMFYQDGRHPLIYTYEPPIQKEEFEAAVDEILGTPIDTLVFCLGEGRTMLHDTQVGEFWGHNVEGKWPHPIFRRAHQNASKLIEEGNDPLQIICQRARAEGFLLYPSLNVQWDSPERTDSASCRVSDFRWDHKHLEIGAAGDVDPDFGGFGCLDFKHVEVQNERFAIVEETMSKYEVDGFELNLNYFPFYFHPKEVEAGREVMTAWVERVYQAVKRSGDQRRLAIRVFNSIQGCAAAGLDLREWLRRGIVDELVVQDHAYRANMMADFRPVVAAAADSPCHVVAALQNVVADPLQAATIDQCRAMACNYWAQGIDGLFLDRGWFVEWPYGASFYEKVRELPYPQLMAPKDKRYHVLTGPGRVAGLETPPALPITLVEGEPADVAFTISDDLARWNAVGRVHDVLLRVGVQNSTELDRLRFKLNGKDLPDGCCRTINLMFRMGLPRNRSVGGYWFIFRPEPDLWPLPGENSLEVTLLERDSGVVGDVRVEHVELETKYMMGRNYYRVDDDPDLGVEASGSRR